MGYRLTPQRQMVLDTLCDLGDHATAGDVYDDLHARVPVIDRATVYRSLNLFHELGLVVAAEINGNTVYEIADPEPHHHLVCKQCSSVEHIHDIPVGEIVRYLEESVGFVAELNHLTIGGVCTQCNQGMKGDG